jgi:multicomponent K+:H+ antiporter subunit A
LQADKLSKDWERTMQTLVIVPLAALLAGTLAQLLLGKVLSRVGKGWLGFIFCLVALGSVVGLIPAVQDGQAVESRLFGAELDLVFRVDGLSVIFGLMATGIGAAILLYCTRYMAHEAEGTTRFYALMQVFIGGLVGLVFSANLLAAYFFWEVIGLCSYFLVGFWYQRSEAARGARKVLLITHAAGYGFLLGILLLYQNSGTFLWTDPGVRAAFTGLVFFLMLVSAMAKSVIFPLHTWIPEAMNAPTPVSALLHSACYVKAGVYLIARLYSLSAWKPEWNTVVLVLGCLTMIVGALFALVQTDLKRLLAFSTISQLGYIITGLGLGTPAGIAAGLFYCLSHGLFKGTLFLCAGAVQHETGTRDMRELGGLASRMPATHIIWLVVAAAIIGVPLTNGFVAKWLLYTAMLESERAVVVLVAWLVSTFTAFYIIKATVSVFYGEMPESLRHRSVRDASPAMLAGMGALAALAVVFGVAPQLLMRWIVVPAAQGLGFTWQSVVTWFGLQSGAVGLPVTAGAVITLLALLVGWAFYAMRRSSGSSEVAVFTGGDPLPEGDRVGTVDFAELANSTFTPAFRLLDPDPIFRALWNAAGAGGQWAARVTGILERRAIIASLVMVVILAAAVWIW